ncbi:hypothetical protein PSPO01_06120 [Paraphaeosphaeria sporulosa]
METQQGEVAQSRKRQAFVHEDGHRQRQPSEALRVSWAAWSGSNRARIDLLNHGKSVPEEIAFVLGARGCPTPAAYSDQGLRSPHSRPRVLSDSLTARAPRLCAIVHARASSRSSGSDRGVESWAWRLQFPALDVQCSPPFSRILAMQALFRAKTNPGTTAASLDATAIIQAIPSLAHVRHGNMVATTASPCEQASRQRCTSTRLAAWPRGRKSSPTGQTEQLVFLRAESCSLGLEHCPKSTNHLISCAGETKPTAGRLRGLGSAHRRFCDMTAPTPASDASQMLLHRRNSSSGPAVEAVPCVASLLRMQEIFKAMWLGGSTPQGLVDSVNYELGWAQLSTSNLNTTSPA